MMRFYYTILICFGISYTGIGQVNIAEQESVNISKIALSQVRNLDEQIILVYPSGALSDEQSKLIFELFSDKIAMTRAIKKSESSFKSKEVNDLMKITMDRLHFEILTKQQREAKFEYLKS